MAKHLKLTTKNAQIAEAINLGSLKDKLAKKKEKAKEELSDEKAKDLALEKGKEEEGAKEEAPRMKARSHSVFAETAAGEKKEDTRSASEIEEAGEQEPVQDEVPAIVEEVVVVETLAPVEEVPPPIEAEIAAPVVEEVKKVELPPPPKPKQENKRPPRAPERPPLIASIAMHKTKPNPEGLAKLQASNTIKERLGPTGKHISDFVKPRPVPSQATPPKQPAAAQTTPATKAGEESKEKRADETKVKPKRETTAEEEVSHKKAKVKEFRDLKPAKKPAPGNFDARNIGDGDDDGVWRKRRPSKFMRQKEEEVIVRPTSLKVRLPISLKDLAAEMKLKASELIAKFLSQGVPLTLNDMLEDPTTVQLLGSEFGCEISIDTAQAERIRITDKSIREEIQAIDESKRTLRPPVVAFMGHVDHGKTSLIDSIRKTNRVSGEAGAITQHIGAFKCHTPVGDITILDTPGHEAFSAMRARGADVTDIVVLVVAGDEGMKQQTIEALQHAKAAKVTIVVAINKADKPNFDQELVYRQLAEQDLLPESWGGQTITVNCSAVTGQGVQQLLEMLALQAEVLELYADPSIRARGTVLESEMHKGLGAVATVLVQNGTLKKGDPVVFNDLWGRIKTMKNEFGQELEEAGPSTPVEVTGLSGLPNAGHEFIVVKSEKEAKEIAEVRSYDHKQSIQVAKRSVESLLQSSTSEKKILNVVLRADVQGSLEAIRNALQKIQSDKVDLSIVFAGVGEISESDVQLAAASKAVILGFHTDVEHHADSIIKQLGVQVRLHDIIYHALDDIRDLMAGQLEKIAQEVEKGKAEVRALFKSSQVGMIIGCQVIEGSIARNHHVRLRRGKDVLWKGSISSLKRVKEDVREVQKGLECGICLNQTTDVQVGDILETYDVIYLTQTL